MTRFLSVAVLIACFLLPAGEVRGEPPAPMPVLMVPCDPLLPPYVGPNGLIQPRRSAYEVWQYYAPDRRGFFRPVVDYTATYGGYYRYNGAPYPWANEHSLYFMPYARD